MLPETFEILLGLVAPPINKKTRKKREPISVDWRLLVTLRYLSTGDAHTTIAAKYRVSPTTIGRIISETCNALWDKLKEAGHIRTPSSVHAWKNIAREFEDRWNSQTWLVLLMERCLHQLAKHQASLQTDPQHCAVGSL